MGNNITCALYCNHRIAAKIYTLEAWFVSGMQLRILRINAINDDDDDDDNNNNNNNKHEVKELQKTATLGTAHILRKVLI